MELSCSATKELTYFGESIVGETSRSLSLIRAIEQTIYAVTLMTDKMQANVKFAQHAIEHLRTNPRKTMCDESGTIAAALTTGHDKVLELYNLFIEKRDAARRDHHIIGDDSIEACYTQAIAAAADLYNSLNDLRWEVYEHDANFELSETGNALSTSEEIDDFFSKL